MQIDAGRQAFSVYFDEDGEAFRLEVSAPDNMSFDGVWDTVGQWLKRLMKRGGGNCGWSDENVEFVDKAVGHAMAMKMLRLFKKTNTKIILVAERADGSYEDCLEVKGGKSIGKVTDISGSLTRFKAELECSHTHHIAVLTSQRQAT